MHKTPAALIDAIGTTRGTLASQPELMRRLAELQQWQVARLRRTYADFSVQDRYRHALEFFMNDLYGPHDYSQRDRDLSKVLDLFERALPTRAIETLSMALQLEWLSQSLDLAMLEAMTDAVITESGYAQAYRRVGRVADRRQQIAFIVGAGRALDKLVRSPAIGAALWAARLPAKVTGVLALHDFLQRGYQAFSALHGADLFLDAIEQRETIIMSNLLAGDRDPFQWQCSTTPGVGRLGNGAT
jgi:hypothetical protein